MAKVYVDLIRKGLKTIDEIPEKIKKEVQALLWVGFWNYVILDKQKFITGSQ